MRNIFVNDMIRTIIANEEATKAANKIVRPTREYNYTSSTTKLITQQEEVIDKAKEVIAKQEEKIAKLQKKIELQEQMIAILQEKVAKYESANESEVEETIDESETVEDILITFILERGCRAINIDNPIADMYHLPISELTDDDIDIIAALQGLMCELDAINEYGDQVCEATIELNTLLDKIITWRRKNEK